MKKYNYYAKATVPAVFVTKGRQRVKQYNDYVYLKNGEEFELELFNPTNNKVLAKISLNGKYLGNGIVLRPGERVFLERYFDEARKFIFETYQVDGNDPNVKEAIKMNGIVEVEFYNEQKPSYTITYTHAVWPPNYPNWIDVTTPIHYYSNTIDCGNQIGSSNNAFYCSSGDTMNESRGVCGVSGSSGICSTNDMAMASTAPAPELKETGRVEKGSYSNQSFTYDSTTFNTYYSWKCTWKIVPESEKPFVAEDLKVFCTNCGAKRKKDSHAFCPHCGTKFI